MSLLARIGAAQASTRTAALLRVGIALLLWARFANDFAWFHGKPWTWWVPGAVICVASTSLLVGWYSRSSAAICALAIAWLVVGIGVGQKQYALLHHHVSLLMIVTLLLALTPCGRSFSVDRWRALQAAERAGRAPPEERGPRWAVWLIALQASAVWFWGGLDKISAHWLSGERLQAIAMSYSTGSDWPSLPGFTTLCMLAAVTTVVVELALAIGLWFPRWHRVLIPICVAFHALIYFMVPVATFTATMFVLLFAYLPPDRVHAAIDELAGLRR